VPKELEVRGWHDCIIMFVAGKITLEEEWREARVD